MSEPAQNEAATTMGPLQEEARPIPIPEDQNKNESSDFLPKEPDIPKESLFAKEPPEPENIGYKEVNQGQQPSSPDYQPETAKQPRSTVVESPNSSVEQTQSQPVVNDLEQPLIDQTAAPGLPSVYEGPEALGRKLSVLGVELAAIRTALKGRLARSLSGFNFPGKVRSKG